MFKIERDNKLMDDFTVNKYISLKLEKAKIGPRYKTNIYVKGEKFLQCKFLLLEIPTNHTESFDHIDSIDEAAELLDTSEEFGTDFPPETEFWGHCSVRHEAVLLNAET